MLRKLTSLGLMATLALGVLSLISSTPVVAQAETSTVTFKTSKHDECTLHGEFESCIRSDGVVHQTTRPDGIVVYVVNATTCVRFTEYGWMVLLDRCDKVNSTYVGELYGDPHVYHYLGRGEITYSEGTCTYRYQLVLANGATRVEDNAECNPA